MDKSQFADFCDFGDAKGFFFLKFPCGEKQAFNVMSMWCF